MPGGGTLDLQQFVDDYINAWNRQDLDGLLGFFHKDGAIYDSFWMETCSGDDLAEYFASVIELERHLYQRIGDVMPTEEGVMFRYGAHKNTDAGPGKLEFYGAEVMIIRDDKLVSVSDFYCDPRQDSLEEVSRWLAKHHGRIRNLGFGLPAVKATQFRDQLSTLMDVDKAFLNPNLTASEVADRVGCSLDQLNQVVTAELGANFYSFVDKYRANYARQLLLESSDDPDYVYDVSRKAGFRTFENFVRSFDRFFQERPEEFYRENSDAD
jgi:AraC-like DNA-binding protein